MRLPPAVDPDLFPVAERCALRLDGDCFELGLTVVAIDALVDAEVRASTLTAAVRQHGLVAETWTAAWVHGAVPRLRQPLDLAVDLVDGSRTRTLVPMPREVRYRAGDVTVLQGVRVTTAIRTAIDLARLTDRFEGEVVRVVRQLLAEAGSDAVSAAVRAEAGTQTPHKSRGVDRLLALRGQPALTR